jgi:hypothetical protein
LNYGQGLDSAVDIATGYWLDGRRFRVKDPEKGIIFLPFTSSRPVLGSTQHPIQWVLGVKLPGHEAHHSLPNNAVVKNTWFYTYTSAYAFMA